MTLAQAFARIDDHLNPIVVKELRQAVRSRLVVGMLMFLLVVLLGAMTLFVTEATNQSGLNMTRAIRQGRDAFEFLLGLFAVTTMLFIPAYTAVRMSKERFQTVADLVFTTTLTPSAIIRGKLMVGMILTMLVFSAFLPFMVLTYFLRGVDLPSVFIILAMAILAQTVTIQFALCIACIPCSRVFKVILGIGAGGGTVFFCVAVISFADELLRYGVGSRLGSSDFWIWTSILLLLAVLAFGFCHVLAVALLSPPTANRAPAVRGYLTGAWIITGIAAFSAPWHSLVGFPLDLELWVGYTLTVLLAMLLISVSEKDTQSPRIRCAIPKSRIKRAVVFCFFSGPANGIAWTFVMMLLTFALGLTLTFSLGLMRKSAETFLIMSAGIFLYSYSYALTGLLIRRKCLTWMQPQNTWLIVILILAVAHLAPLLIMVLIGVKPWPDVIYGNLFQTLDMPSGDLWTHLLTASICAAVITFLNLPWFVKQLYRFTPNEHRTSNAQHSTSNTDY